MNIVTLTNQELDTVLQGLRELPLKVSGELFEKLKGQYVKASGQLVLTDEDAAADLAGIPRKPRM